MEDPGSLSELKQQMNQQQLDLMEKLKQRRLGRKKEVDEGGFDLEKEKQYREDLNQLVMSMEVLSKEQDSTINKAGGVFDKIKRMFKEGSSEMEDIEKLLSQAKRMIDESDQLNEQQREMARQ
jgi:hypothetical protein